MRCTSILLASAAYAGISATAVAQEAGHQGGSNQDGITEIVVTAQKRSQNLQSVPIAITALSAEAIEAKGITQFENLVTAAPGLTITQGTNPTGSSINLRGIGTSAFSIGVEPSVAVVVDDVAILQQAQAFSNLTDIERIEVLRGPQGTLFGKSASAGAINIVTKAPTTRLTGRIALGATTDDEYRLEAGLSGSVAEGVGFRLNGFYSDREGYVRNLTTGSKLGGEESYGVRAKLHLEPSRELDLVLSADYALSETNGMLRTVRVAPPGATILGSPLAPSLVGVNVGPDNYRIRANVDPFSRSEQAVLSARATLKLGDVDLVSITSYQDWKFRFSDDVDMTASDVLGIPGGLIQSSPFHSTVFAQEFRLVSEWQKRFQYLVGLFYSKGETDRSYLRGPSGPLVSNWKATAGTRTYAAFAQATYDVGDTTHLDAGIRFNREKVDVAFQRLNVPSGPLPANNAICLATCVGNATDDQVTGKVALRQDLAERIMVYASYATGYKGQGYDVSSGFTPARAANPVKPETSKSYEIGLKSRLLDNRVQLNITAFLTDYNNFQAQSSVVQPDGSIIFRLNNVGKLRTKGIELELQTKPTTALTMDFAGTYTDAVVREFPFANCFAGQTAAQGCFDIDGTGPLTVTAQNLAGKRLANSPKFKLTAAANYDIMLPRLPFNAFINVDFRYQTSVIYDLAQHPLFVQPSYGILNGSIGIKESHDERYRIWLFVNNILDKHYASNIAAATGGPPNVATQILPRDSRRYFGIRVNYNF